MSPRRVKVQGDLFHGRVPDGAVYIGRRAPGLPQSYFHNPFKVGMSLDGWLGFGDGRVKDRADAVILFEEHVSRLGRQYRDLVVKELAGKDLACWCPLPKPSDDTDWCHGTVLLHLARGHRRWPDITPGIEDKEVAGDE